MASGQQQKIETIAITKLLGTGAAEPPDPAGGVQFCDMFGLLCLNSDCEFPKNDEACLKNHACSPKPRAGDKKLPILPLFAEFFYK